MHPSTSRAIPASLIGLAALLSATAVDAADTDDPAKIPEVVVTANRIAAPSFAVGSSVTVVTAEEIERLQARDVLEVLRRVPGVSSTQSGGAGQTATVRLRGAEGYHTLVLIDGVEVADGSGTQPITDFGHLLVADIERIEVVRGPQSTLYGGDAIGGVIQIFTRKAGATPRRSVTIEGGSYGMFRGSASASGRSGRFGYAVSVAGRRTDGFSAADERTGNSEIDGTRDIAFNGRVDFQAADNLSFETVLRRTHSVNEYDGSSNTAPYLPTDDDLEQRTEATSGSLSAKANALDGRLRNTAKLSFAQTNRDYFDGDARSYFYDSWKDKIEDQIEFDVLDSLTLVGGLEVERERAGFDTFKDSVTSRAVFGEAVIAPLDDLEITLGARLDDHGRFGEHATYRATGSYRLTATESRLHGSIGTGFRAPSLYELYAPATMWGGVGNANLRPEENVAADLGIEQTLWEGRIVADVTAYVSRTRDLIEYGSSGYANIDSARSFGFESSIEADVTDTVGVTARHTYLETRDNSSGGMLSRRPKHAGLLGVFWDATDDLRADVDWVLQGRRKDGDGIFLGGYGRVDLRVAYRITPELSVTGRIENLLDKDYEEVNGYGTAGVSGYVGMSATF